MIATLEESCEMGRHPLHLRPAPIPRGHLRRSPLPPGRAERRRAVASRGAWLGTLGFTGLQLVLYVRML